MKPILLGLTRQYLNAVRLCSAPLWFHVILLLVGGPMLAKWLMQVAGGGEIDAAALPINSLCVGAQVAATLFFSLAAVVGMFQKPRYIFALPVSAKVLTSWQFAASAITITFSNVSLIIAYRLLLDVSLPLASTLAMITATHLLVWLVWQFVPAMESANSQPNSLFDASIRRQFLFMVVRLVRWAPVVGVFVFYVVFRMSYRDRWLRDPVLWDQLTLLDVFVLSSISGVAWLMVTREINAQRCGEVANPTARESADTAASFVAAKQNVPQAGTWKLEEAHAWFHWQAGRTLLVFGAIFVVPFSLLICAVIYVDKGNNKLHGGFAIFEMMSAMGALMIGAAIGMSIINPAGRKEMSKHVAVVPVTDQSLARTLMKTLVRTLGGAWGLLVAMCVVALISYVFAIGTGNVVAEIHRLKVFNQLGYWFIPLALLGSMQLMWTTGGLTATLAWTGREQFFSIITVCLIFSGLTVFTVIKLAMPIEHQELCFTVALGLAAVVVVGLLLWTYASSRARKLVQTRVVHVAVACWVVEGALVVMFSPVPLPVRISIAAMIGLSVLPLTASPLAVAWNRHR